MTDFRPGATLAALRPDAPPAPYANCDAMLFLHDDVPKCWAIQPPRDALDKSERVFIEEFAVANGLRVNFHRAGWLEGRALVVFRLAPSLTTVDDAAGDASDDDTNEEDAAGDTADEDNAAS